METAIIKSPVGTLKISGDEDGVRSVLFADEVEEETGVPASLLECVKQLKEYFEGNRRSFDLKINPLGTEFQKKVWYKLLEIPYAEVISYLELSKRLGNVKAIRAVGHANGQNRINIIIPCHRVIGSDSRLVGYGGGLWRKEWLLRHEAGNSIPGLFSGTGN